MLILVHNSYKYYFLHYFLCEIITIAIYLPIIGKKVLLKVEKNLEIPAIAEQKCKLNSRIANIYVTMTAK